MSVLRGVPLAVRVVGPNVDRHITGELRDLSYRSTAVGGFASARFALDRPIRTDAPEMDVLNKVYVYDRRSAEIVWQGYLEDPGRSAGSDGLVWAVSAVGPAGRAQDIVAAPIYVDQSQSQWRRDSASQVYMKMDSTQAPFALQAQAPRGVAFNIGHEARWTYKAIADAGMEIGRLQVAWDTGVTDANISIRLRGAPSAATWTSATANTAGGTLSASRGGAPAVTAGDTTANIIMTRITSNLTVANDDTWATFASIFIRGMLMTKTGVLITSGYTTNSVLASEVVADVLGRMLPAFDGATATVDLTSYAIDQLAYPDAATAVDILADLLILEPAYRWAAWADTVNGKHAFEWTLWPTTIRYQADVSAGFSAPESSMDLYDSVLVRWTDADDIAQNTVVTGSVPALQGIARRGLVDLGSAVGSAANATRAGQQFLTEHSVATNSGTLTIAGPIVDSDTARMVLPHQIRPGHLIRVHGINARPDALNPVQNGTTVFRIASTEYRASDNSAVLELDSYSPSLARAIADVRSQQSTARRR